MIGLVTVSIIVAGEFIQQFGYSSCCFRRVQSKPVLIQKNRDLLEIKIKILKMTGDCILQSNVNNSNSQIEIDNTHNLQRVIHNKEITLHTSGQRV